MNFQNYNAAIFDCDGTLLDSMPLWRNYSSRIVKLLGYEPIDKLDEICDEMSLIDSAKYISELYKTKETKEEIIKLCYENAKENYYTSLLLKPKAIELLDKLKKLNYKMVVATATPKDLVEACLRRNKVIDYFIDVISVFDYNTTKSEPKIYFEAMKIMNSTKENTIIFEDAYHAIKTCSNAKLNVVGVVDTENKKDFLNIKKICLTTIDLY